MLPIRDTIPARNPPIAVWLLILANGLVFLFELMMPGASIGGGLLALYRGADLNED